MNNEWNVSYLIYNNSQWITKLLPLSHILILIFENNIYIQTKIYSFIIYNINNIFSFNFSKKNFLISKFFFKNDKKYITFSISLINF